MVLQRAVALPSHENQPNYLNLELPELALGDVGPALLESVLPPPRLVTITDYSPDWDYTEGGSKVPRSDSEVLITSPELELGPEYEVMWHNAVRVPATPLMPGVLRCLVPPHPPGISSFFLLQDGTVVSQPKPFVYKDRDAREGLSGPVTVRDYQEHVRDQLNRWHFGGGHSDSPLFSNEVLDIDFGNQLALGLNQLLATGNKEELLVMLQAFDRIGYSLLYYILSLNEWSCAEKLLRFGCRITDLDTAGGSLFDIALRRFNGERLDSLNHLLRLAWRKYPVESKAAVTREDGEGLSPLERSSWSGVHQQLQEMLSPATLIGTVVFTPDAAVKIQTLYRERSRRPHHNQENKAPPIKELEHAALTIQCFFRYKKTYRGLYRTRIAERDAAARKIQSVWKKHKAYS